MKKKSKLKCKQCKCSNYDPANDNIVSLKEIRKELYQLRNFEISNLWQRSIFLSALIVLSFTGYGSMVSELIKGNDENKLIVNFICICIATFGFILSIIWIKMAKGSKAWYEVYEEKIKDIENEKDLNIDPKYKYDSKCQVRDLDHNLFKTNPGQYSASKINILIGRLIMWTWIADILIHSIIYINLTYKETVITLLCIIPIIIMITMILILLNDNIWTKSNALKKKE